jgi:hypothetical protein
MDLPSVAKMSHSCIQAKLQDQWRPMREKWTVHPTALGCTLDEVLDGRKFYEEKEAIGTNHT